METLPEAPCGLLCEICYLFRAGTDEAVRSRVAQEFTIPMEKASCPGCRAIEGFCPVIDGQCATFRCAREKRVVFCSECMDFPCRKLMPCADRASQLPQNIKVFSLTLRKNAGEEEWRKIILEVYRLYFRGKMVIGSGPVPGE
ncbi:MAG: DUF3795 domain-containing protein [Methanolinea sp.]|jgi:hypothetical protein|nr:DUF3795 domain-containing protein [Methanolinea sp.]